MGPSSANPFDTVTPPPIHTPPLPPRGVPFTVGPGGSLETLPSDLDSIVGTSHEALGAPDQHKRLPPKTQEPRLPDVDEKMLEGLQPSRHAMIPVLLGVLGVDLDVLTSKAKKKTSRHGEDLTFVREGETLEAHEGEELELGEFSSLTGLEAPPQGGEEGAPLPETKAFDDWTEGLSDAFFSALPPLDSQTQKKLSTLTSTDANSIYALLLQLAQVDTLDASLEEKEAIRTQLQSLSQTIAQANEDHNIDLSFLRQGCGFLIQGDLRALLHTPNNPKAARTPYDVALTNLCDNLAEVNAEAASSEANPLEEFTSIFGNDSLSTKATLDQLLKKAHLLEPLPEGVTQEEVDTLLQALASKIVLKHQAKEDQSLQTVAPETLTKELEELLQEAGIMPSPQLLSTILPSLAQEMSKVNREQMQSWLYSSNQGHVQQALEELSGVNRSDLKKDEKETVKNYLQVLTMALILMAQIRSYIAQLDGLMSNEVSKAQMANISEQLKLSQDLLIEKLSEAKKQFEVNATQIATANFLKIFMPIVALVLALIALASVIATICTAGAAAPLSAVAITCLVLAVAASVVTVGISIADLVSEATTGKSIWEKIFEAIHVTDETTQNWIQSIVMIALAVLTVGAGMVSALGSAIANAVKTAVAQGLKEGLKAFLKALLQSLKDFGKFASSTIGKMVISTLILPVLTAPIISQSILKALKALLKNDTEAIILTAVIMVLISIASILLLNIADIKNAIGRLTGKLKMGAPKITPPPVPEVTVEAPSAPKPTVSAVPKGPTPPPEPGAGAPAPVETPPSKTEAAKEAEAVAGQIANDIKPLVEAEEVSTETLKAIATRLIKKALERLYDISQLLDIISNVIQAISNFNVSQIKKELAQITFLTGALEACFDEVATLRELGVDAMLKMVSDAEGDFTAAWEALCNEIADFIESAMKFMDRLHTVGAA